MEGLAFEMEVVVGLVAGLVVSIPTLIFRFCRGLVLLLQSSLELFPSYDICDNGEKSILRLCVAAIAAALFIVLVAGDEDCLLPYDNIPTLIFLLVPIVRVRTLLVGRRMSMYSFGGQVSSCLLILVLALTRLELRVRVFKEGCRC